MEINDLSKHTSSWFNGQGPHCDIVISSRIRLARNLAGYEFLSRLTLQRQQEILDKLKHSIMQSKTDMELCYFDVDGALEVQRELLSERHLISRHLASGKGPRGVIISTDESFTAMMNEEDHLRIQMYRSGLDLNACWDVINRIDDLIEESVEYAFSPRFGYLTACPTNVGTGIRVSVMLHLPALKMTGQIEKFFNAAKDLNLVVRGLFGEGTDAVGDFFQLSNQVTLGRSEREIIDEFAEAIVPKIIDFETAARHELLTQKADILDDKIQRAMGVLKNARLISSQEAMFLLSNVRLGVNLKRIDDISIDTVNELFLLTQPGHLQINAGKSLDPQSRDITRAQIIREKLLKS